MSRIPFAKWFAAKNYTRTDQGPTRPVVRWWRWGKLHLERLEDRTNPAPIPTVVLPPPTTALIGATVPVSVTFSNTGDATGYGPFVDVELPTAGNVPASSNGLSFVSGSATYLGVSVQTQVLTFPASGQVTHPFLLTSSGQHAVITGTPGDELVVFTLPLGSFTPNQPAATIDFSAQLSTLATVSVPLPVTATGGFQFGADPVNDPTTDTPIVGTPTTSTVTPTLFQVQKTYLGPEQETATGPNFVQQFQVSVQVAAGQTITNFDLTDTLPNNMQFVGVTLLHANGSTTATLVRSPSTTTPGGVLEGLFDQVVGTGTATDVVADISFYVPEFNANGDTVLPPGTGVNVPVVNNVTGTGNFIPLPGSGNAGGTVTDSASDTITAKQLAIQKSVQVVNDVGSPGPSRGDTLEYTLNFQVSDFFALENLIATDVLSDGQAFVSTFTPTISFTQHGVPVSGAFPAGTFRVVRNIVTTGRTRVTFNVAQALADLGLSTGTAIFGGDVSAPGDTHLPPFDGTTGTITFRARIANAFLRQPSPRAPVVQGDKFSDNASTSGAVLNNATLNPTGNTASDTTSATVTIPHGVFTKSVYAINGVVGADPNSVTVGDRVTYRLTFTLPEGNVKDYRLTDFPPLPIFPLSTMTFIPGQSIPAVNTATFGPADTFFAVSHIVPVTTVNTASNAVNFNFGSFSRLRLASLTSDVLFTVRVGSIPFADGLFLSNLGVVREDSNTGGSFSSSAIAQIKLNEPSLVITKGVVSTTSATASFTTTPAPPGVTFAAPGTTTRPPFTGLINTTGLASSPINADLVNAQANDFVRFAIVVENVGAGQHGAFNVTVADAFPTSPVPNYTFVAGSLQVDDGAGDPLAFTGTLFTGIHLTDPSRTLGSLGPGMTPAGIPIDTGTNIAVITYDVELDTGVKDNLPLVNTATLKRYSGSPKGNNFVPQGLTAQASVTPAHAKVTKELVGTSFVNRDNTLTQATIGERVDYTVTALFPDVTTPNAMLVDDLAPINLAYVNDVPVTITATSELSFSVTPTPVISNNGQTLTINFGTITNNDGTDQKVTVSFEAVVLNVAANVNGVTFANTAVTSSDDGTQSVTSAPVTIVEPKLATTKTVSIAGGGTAQGGSTATYTITIAQDPNSTTDAFNTTFSDALPLLTGGGSVLLSPTFTVTDPLGLVTNANFQLTGSNAAGWMLSTTPTGDFDLFKSQPGRVITLTITGTVSTSVVAGQKYTNTDDIQWTSLPGNPVIPSDNPNASERTGAGGINNYFASSSASFIVAAPTIEKSLVGTSVVNHNNGTSQAVIGEQAEYRVTVTIPDGEIPAADVVDQLPAGLAFVKLVSFTNNDPDDVTLTGDPTSPTVTNNGHTVTYNLGDMTNSSSDPTAVHTLTFVYDAVVLNVASNIAGTTLANSAQLLWNNGANQSNTASAAPVTVIEPQLTTTKSVSGATNGGFIPGDTITYTITLQQANTVDANNVTLTDMVPQLADGSSIILSPTFLVSDPFGHTVTNANFQLTGSNATGWELSTNPADPFNLINIVPSRVVTITVTGTISPNVTPGLAFTNTDDVQWTSLPGPDPGQISQFNIASRQRTGTGTPAVNDYFTSASAFATISPFLDLAIVKTVSNPHPAVGEEDTFTLVLTNNGPSDGTGVVVDDPLPSGLSFVSDISSPGTTYDPTTGVWTVGNLAVGASVTLTLTVQNNSPDPQTNTATASSNERDIDPSNNTDSASVQPLVDLAIVKTVSNPHPAVGEEDTFTLVLTNNGPGDASGVVVNDPLPSGLSFVSDISSPGTTYDPTTGVWTVGNLAVGASVTLTLTVQNNSPDPQTNTATTSSREPDSNPSNNTDSASVQPLADLAVVKTVSDSHPQFNQQITYTVVATNNGPGDASGVVVSDLLPSGLTFVSATPTPGTTYDPASGVWTIGQLDVGASVTLSITATVTSVTPITNVAEISGREPDPNHSNNTDSVIVIPPANSSLAGSVYFDTNDNGKRDPREVGISGAIVTLTGMDASGHKVSAKVVTDAHGHFLFLNLFPGAYTLTETQPPQLLDGRDRVGTLGGVLGNNVISSIQVGPQQAGTLYEFGELGLVDPGKFWLLGSTDLSSLVGPPGSGVINLNPGP
jgi:uncharacterized repeat protein (TIGR01451 family)/fimbrial isopeptide formation D2 family protein